MLDDFFTRALIAGIGMAAVLGPLGCFVVWRRLSYFGDTLAHAAMLGIALSLVLSISPQFAVFLVAIIVALAMLAFQRSQTLSSDTILGILSHGSLAIGLLALAFMTWVRVDLLALLFGDLLAVSKPDIVIIYAGGVLVLATLAFIWKPLFAATVNREMAAAEGMHPSRTDVIFMLLLAAVISVSIKIVGVLLITAMLIIPAGIARRFATGPVSMAVLAAVTGIVSVLGGLNGSLAWDTPSGPSIVFAALVLFLASQVVPRFKRSEIQAP